MKYKILILTILIFLIPKDTHASFVGNSLRPLLNCTTGINCGLVGYWTFDGKDIVNGVIKDVSGNGNDGNTTNIASSTFYTPGKIGQGANFDGVNDYMNLSSTTLLNNSNWTFSVWAKLSGNQTQYILTHQSGGPVVNGIGLYLGKMLYYHYNGSWTISTGNATVADNEWHLLTWVNYSNQTMDMYIDGILDASGISSSVLSGSYGYVNRIGSWYGSPPGSGFLKGLIDDVRIYKRALSAQEIQQLYNMGSATKVGVSKPVSSTCVANINCGLVGYWTFDGKDIVNGVIKDVSGNGNNGNPLNIASSTFYTPGKIGQGVKSKGSDYVVVPDSASLKPSGAMSWGGWSYQTTKNSNQAALSKVTISTSGYMLYNNLGTQQYCFAYGLTPNAITDGVPIEKDKWAHYMCVYDGSTFKIYRNGELKYSTPVTGSITHSTNQLRFPSYTSGGFLGSVDDIRIYNRALSAQEVQQLYSMGANTKIGATAVASSTSACSSGLSCGLVGYWTFDGKDISNGVLLDKSGNNNKGNLISIASTTFYAPGKIGQGANFDGVGYVSAGDNLDLIGSPFTLAAWIYPKSYSGTSSNTPGVIDKLGAGGNYRLNVSLGVVSFGIRSSDNTFEGMSGTSNSAPLNKWTHVLVTYDNSTTARIYVNGVLNVSKTDFTITRGNSGVPLLIGDNNNNTNSNFNGKIDDVRIYNRVLSVQEIQQLYNQGK